MFTNVSPIRNEFTNTKKLVKKLARIKASTIRRQQFANVFAHLCCSVTPRENELSLIFSSTHQLEFASFSLPCEGRFTLVETRLDPARRVESAILTCEQVKS